MMLKKTALLVCAFLCVFLSQSKSFGQTTTFKSGTAIIDMGSASPTVKNSLKPYGLIYALLKNNHVPVSYVVNSAKVQGGADFVYNGKGYKGGTFIVSGEFINADVQAVLTNWANQGVVIDYTNSPITVDVTFKINFLPKWVMDKTNGSIGVSFLNAAGIPASAYSFKQPADLGTCDDIFVLPHADPTWADHGNLLTWNTTNKGAIWAGCHAVSELENLWNGSNPATKMNFLSTNGLVPFTDHNPTATPFSNFLPGDPVGQYIGKTDNAQLSGSETVYLPKVGSAWRAGAKILTTSPSQSDLPSLDAGAKAVENIYGRAFDVSTNGYVAYQASHNIAGSNADQVAAQRMFFNFSFFAMNDKIPPIINLSLGAGSTQLKSTPTTGETSAPIVATNLGGATVTEYAWSVSPANAGTLNTPTANTTTFTAAPNISVITTVIVTCVVKEACGRVSFDSKTITIIPDVGYPAPATINKSIPESCQGGSITFNIFDDNVNANGGVRTMTSFSGIPNGTVSSSSDGKITFTANAGYKGTTSGTYKISNDGGATESASGTINITVGDDTQVPKLIDDAGTALVNTLKVFEVLPNDRSTQSATDADLLYIRSARTVTSKGYAYVNPGSRTISYVSKNAQTGVEQIEYQACNTAGYCATGTLSVTLVDNCGTGLYQTIETLTPLTQVFIPTADTYLNGTGGSTTTNYGNATALNVMGLPVMRSLITFGGLATAFSTTALVKQATLTLTTSATYTHPAASSNGASTFPFTVAPLSKSYNETGTYYAVAAGWQAAGAGGATDFTTTGQADFPFTSGVTLNAGDEVGANVTTMVQNWITTPANNFGFRLAVAGPKSQTYSFYSREGTTPPKLTVKYYPCAPTPTSYIPIVYPDAAATSSSLTVTISPLTNDVNYYNNNQLITLINGSAAATVNTFSGTASITGGGNTILYTPSGGFVGVDTLNYTVTDQVNGTSNTASIRITVTRSAPTLVNDVATVNSGTLTSINVGANDVGYGGLGAPIIVTQPSNGIAVVNGNNVDYTPTSGFSGTDQFTYRRVGVAADACSAALSSTATVTITVNNQPPVAGPGTINTFACITSSLKVLDIASDPEGGALSAVIVSAPGHGTVVAKADGTLVYTPGASYSGVDAFTYRVVDPLGVTSGTATVSITVSGASNPNIAPIASADADVTLMNHPVYTNVISNDTDPNSDPLTVSITALGLTAPASGTITLMPNKLIKYTPATNFVGTDTYQYQITDSHVDGQVGCGVSASLSSITTVTITVKGIPTTLSGTVWNDADQSAANSFVNIKTNTETGTSGNGGVYVYVLDGNSIVIDKTPVDIDGTYLLSNVPSGTANLKLLLSSEDVLIGAALPAGSVPNGYNNSTPLSRALPTTTLADMGPYDWGIFTNPTLTPGTIIAPATVCSASAVPGTLSSTANATGGSITATGYVYQWQSSLNNTNFGNIAGATTSSYTPSGALTTTTYFRRKVSTNLNAAVYSNVVTITYTTSPTIVIAPATATIAAGGNIGLTASGADTYVWAPATGLSGTTTAAVTATPLSTTRYTVTGTITPSGCTASASITVTVVNAGTIGSDQNNCGPFTPATLSSLADASGATGITYTWEASVTSASIGFSTIAGATAATYVPAGAITTTTYFRRVATAGGQSARSNVVTATVKPLPSVNVSPTAVTLAAGTSTTLAASGADTYDWAPATYLSATNTASVIATPTAVGATVYTVTGRITATGCTAMATVVMTAVPAGSLIPGTIGSPQTICASTAPVAFTSTAATGGTGTINYQWQRSLDNVTFSNIPAATSANYGAGTLTQTYYYRRAASTSSDAAVYTPSVKVTVLQKPVIVGGINGVCAMPRDTVKTFSVTPAALATTYVWTVPATGGWSGSSSTNTINVKAGNTNGVITVTPYNQGCAGTQVTYNIAIIDYAQVTITGTPVTASGTSNDPINVKIQLYDVLGNIIGCSGGPATLCSSGGTFTKVTDNGDGTYTSQLISTADNVTICGSVAGVAISKTTTVTFTGPQGGIRSNGPIFDFETPRITFTATEGRAPFTVIYHSDKSPAGKNDTLRNVTSGTAYDVAKIPATTLYRLVKVTDANGETRDRNFIRDTTTTRVVIPKVIITLKADPARKEADSTWATRIVVHTKNIGDLDLANSQARLNLKDVFPNPVTYVLDSVKVSGTTVVQNMNYDGVNNSDLFAKLTKKKTFNAAGLDMTGMAPDGTREELWNNDEDETVVRVGDDGHSIYMFGPQSNLPVGMDATIILWLHVKPNGYTEPFVMQAVALGTGHTQDATSLTTSLSNDNDKVEEHPEVTKKGDPLPAVINLFPTASIGVALNAGTPVEQGNGTYNVLLSYKLRNYGNVNLRDVKLQENLLRSILTPSTFNVVGGTLTATGGLNTNNAFDAKADTNMLTGTNLLGFKQEATVSYVINITPNQLQSVYRLQALASGYADDLLTTVTDLSTDGTNPDPDDNNVPSEKVITTIIINTPVPPLKPGDIGIKTGSTTVLANGYCGSADNVEIIPTSVNTGGLDAYLYQWQSSPDNITFKDIIGAEAATYTTGSVKTSYYLRRATISGSQVKYSNSVYIQIYTVPATPVITGTGTMVIGKGNITLMATQATGYVWSTGATTRSIVVGDPGNYTVTVSDANGCTATATAYAITSLEPGKAADIQKILSSAPVLQQDGSFLVSFNLVATNLRGELLDSVKITDDLTKVFPIQSTWSLADIKASGGLIANPSYDGKTNINLLSDVSKLPAFKKDSLQFTLKVFPNGFAGTLNNVAVLTANSPLGKVSVSSNDPLTNSDPTVRAPTKFVIPVVDIFIPTGFSPNNDGYNDYFVITRPFNTTIKMEIYNRWSNLVYKSLDYKNEWNGKGNQANRVLGEDLPDGTYYYEILAVNNTNGTVRKFAGYITLKR